MPITRTPWIDDDGTGTTGTIVNNAEKTLLYNQIDAVVNTAGTWTPTDASGAGLALTVGSAKYYRVGQIVFFWAQVSYPPTTNTADASIGGLPFPNTSGQNVGAYITYGPRTHLHLRTGESFVLLLDPATQLTQPNSAYSGATLMFQGFYHLA